MVKVPCSELSSPLSALPGLFEKLLRFDSCRRTKFLFFHRNPETVHVVPTPAARTCLSAREKKPSCTWQIRKEKDADCKPALPEHAPLWQCDYWDRFIRNERHFVTAKRYIEENPVAAGLVVSSEMWPWESAYLHAKSG